MNLLSINDLSREDVLSLFELADRFRLSRQKKHIELSPELIGLLFFQSSTRTRVGFEAAAWKLGYKTVFLDETKPSISKGWTESMSDTIQTMNAYAHAFFIRHPDEHVFDSITPYTRYPVINCGNGYDEHPTQALIDLYAIRAKFGRVDNLTLTFIGDSRYSRSAHSLALLLGKLPNNTVNEITPDELDLPTKYRKGLKHFNRITKKMLGKEDVLYSAGFPPINPTGTFSQKVVRQYIVTESIEGTLAKNCIIMNPLPRIDEIDMKVDKSPKAYYFQQNELGLWMRMAIIEYFITS